jgi:dihydrofolate synthase / folylpolyglutamate synthase
MKTAVDSRQSTVDRFSNSLRWLYATQLTGIKLGLDNMRRLLLELGFDETPGRFPPLFLHVAGTNGKGSVSAMLDALCRASGFRTGLYTSPHLISFCERIQVDGVTISQRGVSDGIERLRKLTRKWEHPPTFFEYATALALEHFRDERAEIIVWETGLGGRLDATNVVQPAVSVLTPVAMDHQNYLGNTLGEVAAEKAGIIKPGAPVVSAPQDPLVEQIFRVTAATLGSPIDFIDDSWSGPLGLEGEHQRNNAALAVAALRAAGLPLRESSIAPALETVSWPGRFQVLEEGRLVLDGAHNPGAAGRLVETWKQRFGAEKATVILAMMRDKDAASFARALAPLTARWLTIAARNPRAHSAESLRDVVNEFAPAEACGSLREALDRARWRSEPILICGSLYLVGEALAMLKGESPPEETWQ